MPDTTTLTDDDPDLFGECDTCEARYELASREGRCGDCGECSEHCTHPNVGTTPVSGAYARPRCYHEFCNATPTLHRHDYAEGASGPFDRNRPVYEYRGVWGFCEFHLPRIMGGQHQ